METGFAEKVGVRIAGMQAGARSLTPGLRAGSEEVV